jgi:stringent starvation protein B
LRRFCACALRNYPVFVPVRLRGISRKVFANQDAAEAWFAENDPEGVAFDYEVIGPPA